MQVISIEEENNSAKEDARMMDVELGGRDIGLVR